MHTPMTQAFLSRSYELFLFATLLACSATWTHAAPTEITVRVLSRDAKFIGSSMGGARITVRDVHTGELLATGVTAGSTGTTKRVMHSDGGRRARLTDNDAAAFNTSIELDRPRLIEVEALAPLAQAQASNRVSASQWVIPGKHLNGGDGWVLEMPGFAVDILAPPAHMKLAGANTEVIVTANVVMMCGCPIEPDGLWDANRFEVAALVERDGEKVGNYALAYAGQTSQFAFELPLAVPGNYHVTVYAYDKINGNTGLDRTSFFAQ